MGGGSGLSGERKFLLARVRAAAAGLHLNRLDDDRAIGIGEAETLPVLGLESFSQMLDKVCLVPILISLPLDGGGLGRG